MNKSDTAALTVVGLVLLVGGGAAFASTRKPGGTVIPGKPKVTPSGSSPPPPKVPSDPKADGAALVKRANQKAALAWAGPFANDPIGISPLHAAALARWAGIESSGKATAKSRLDERGLLQAGPQSVAEGALTDHEWAMLIDPATTGAQHTFLNIKYADWLAKRAEHHLVSPPTDPVDRVWYAKLYHQRPVDVRDSVGPLTHQLSTTDARTIATTLATTWANDAKAMHRLRAANVVAWGTPTP